MRPGWLLLAAALASAGWADESLTFVAPDRSEVALRPEPGRPLVIHFWATWCPSCAEDIANLQRAFADCAGSEVRLHLVNVGDDEEEVRSFTERHEIRLPVLRDPKGDVWRRIDRRRLPTNLFWSTESRKTELGPKTESDWRRALEPLGCVHAGSVGESAEPAGSPR